MITKKMIALVAVAAAPFMMAQFSQTPLPYAYDALEGSIDAKTMEIHYTKHAAGYVNNLNKAIKGTELEKESLKGILSKVSQLSTAIRNNVGGHYNHELFWTILTPKKNTQISPELNAAIVKDFGSVEALKEGMNKAASERFGSGWAWLVVTPEKKLVICSTPNQDNPLMDIAETKGTPILGIDVWEHAYYLKYQNKRADYLGAIWNVINWEEVSKRYADAVKGKFDDWAALKTFHEVMSQTFHPSEKGDLAPIKKRSAEMTAKAKALQNSQIPAEFKTASIQTHLAELTTKTEILAKRIKAKAKDAEITKLLYEAHEAFHHLIGACSEKH